MAEASAAVTPTTRVTDRNARTTRESTRPHQLTQRSVHHALGSVLQRRGRALRLDQRRRSSGCGVADDERLDRRLVDLAEQDARAVAERVVLRVRIETAPDDGAGADDGDLVR